LVHYAGENALRKNIGLEAPLRLEGLEKLESLNGTQFAALPESVRLQFLLRPIKVVTLSDKSDTVVRFDLFERLNTGGVKLSDQEIRACVYRGRFNDFLQEMASTPDFEAVVNLPPARREDRTNEELVLRFFAFLERYKTFEHSVVGFLNEYMHSAMSRRDYPAVAEIFRDTFRSLAKALPDGIRRSARRSTPINLYEAVAVGAAMAIRQNGDLKTEDLTWITGPELKRLTTGATNQPSMVRGRIEYAADKWGWTQKDQ